MTDLIPEDTKKDLRYLDAHEMPENSDGLWSYVAAYLGYKVPRVSVCPEHIAPFSLLDDLFFERETNAVILANRSGGKTRLLSILNHLNAIHKELYEVANIGSITEQAKKGYSYLQEYADTEWFGQDIIYSIMRETKYRNGSVVQVLSGTLAGVNSPHPLCLIADEVELMSWDVLQEAFSCAQSKMGYKAINILASTRKYASGNMYRLLTEKPKEPSWPFKIYAWCLWESLQRCTLPDCSQCKNIIRIKDSVPESWYSICHDISEEGMEQYPEGKARISDGFYFLEDAWTKFTTLDYDKFDAQWLSKKPGRKGLVFAAFDRPIHCQENLVKEWRQRLKQDRWNQEPEKRSLEIAVLMDPGWAAPLGVLFVAKDRRDNLFYFDSIYRAELDFRDLKPMILERFDKYNMLHDFPIQCDERAAREIADLCKLGLKASAVWLSPSERMRLTRKWLDGNYRKGYPGVCVDPDMCTPLCVELETLKLPLDKEGNPKAEMPNKGPNHLIDCAGYGFKALGLAGAGVVIKLMRAPKQETPSRLAVPTRSDWLKR